MGRHDERERIRRQLGALTVRVEASRGAGFSSGAPATSGGSLREAARGEVHAYASPENETDPADVAGKAAGRWHFERPPSPNRRATESGEEVDDDEPVGQVQTPRWLDEPPRGPGWWERLVPERFHGARINPGRRGVLTLAMVGLAAVAVATVMVFRERPVAHAVPPLPAVRTSATPVGTHPVSAQTVPAATGALPAPEAAELVVAVVGLVQRGGLVRLPDGARVADALAAAGGARDGADLTGINLAQRVQDGDQILVGATAPAPGTSSQSGSTTITATGGASSRPSAGPTGKVDLNKATEAELDALPGIGPVTASAITAWRRANGRFTDLEQLGEVDGIGPARLARLRDLVTI
ncbi:ComEA family DNA-binding protein [Nocardia amikacinitolerans]|uniref:ComEA family DNA-binding protein n=1 Tax=Nocardia amikacinitolerans TaxID=756689 RepID=UPI00355813A8